MGTATRILVPLDLSERSEAAAEYGADLARALTAQLILVVNVNEPERRMLEHFAHEEQITLEQAAEAALRRVARRWAEDLDVRVMVRQADNAVVGLLEAIDHADADLVVMASHGRSGMTRWLLGSMTEKLVRAADVPVLVVPVRHRTHAEG